MTRVTLRTIALAAIAGALLSAQGLDNKALSGRYFFRHLQLTSDASSNITSAKTAWGTLTFNGTGGFTVTAQEVIGTSAASALSGSGTYSVQASGAATMTNPQQSDVTMNVRIGSGVIIASSTEGNSPVFDLLIAVPAIAGSQATPTLNGTYYLSSLDFGAGSTAQAHSAFASAAASNGSFGMISSSGQMANAGGAPTAQTIGPVAFTVSSDASGTLTFPLGPGGNAALISGSKVLYVAPDGNTFIAGSPTSHDLIAGIKTGSGGGLSSLYSFGGLRFEKEFNAYVGSLNSPAGGRIMSSRRLRSSCSQSPILLACQPGVASAAIDVTAVTSYTVASDGTVMSPDLNRIGWNAIGTEFVGSSAGTAGVYELFFAFRPPVTNTPLNVVNAASFAPPETPVSPGQFVTIFGTNLTTETQTATRLPFPTTLGGIQVLVNGVAAPLYDARPTQVSALIPFGTPPGTATIAIGSSNATVRVAKSSPGVFTVPSAGIGPAAALHADYTLVDKSHPAKPGETILVYLTGLGTVTPSIRDGDGAPSAPPFSTVNTNVRVFIAGNQAQIAYKGAAPGYAGLYQLNVVVPAGTQSGIVPIAIETPDSFHDQVDLAVGP